MTHGRINLNLGRLWDGSFAFQRSPLLIFVGLTYKEREKPILRIQGQFQFRKYYNIHQRWRHILKIGCYVFTYVEHLFGSQTRGRGSI